MRVLVVDDHLGVRRLIRAALRTEAQVDEAADWATAQARIREGGYRAVLLDLSLPGAPSPPEMVRAVQGAGPGSAVIVITGRPDAVGNLPDGVMLLTKPFDIADLRRIVGSALRPGTAGT